MKYSNMVRLKRRSHPLLLMLKSSVPSSISLVRGFLRASAHRPVAFSGACEGWMEAAVFKILRWALGRSGLQPPDHSPARTAKGRNNNFLFRI